MKSANTNSARRILDLSLIQEQQYSKHSSNQRLLNKYY